MSNTFLYCNPTVFVIGNEYEILINLREFGLCFLKVGDTVYYEENSGVLPSERTVVKIRVPQSELDKAKEYEIIYRKTEERKGYWSTFFAPQTIKFAFKTLEKTKDVNVFYISDVHYWFDISKKTAGYFGDDVDLFVVNGDIGEVETDKDFLDVCEFVGDISKGTIPVLFSRGNHDTRGRLAEKFTHYFPCQSSKTYYAFNIGCISGVVLDCGEDKVDVCEEYDNSTDTPIEYLGINRFHEYRLKQLEFLKGVELDNSKINLAVSHICPAMITLHKDSQFDIDREVYNKWCVELDRMGLDLMLCGHYHKKFLIMPDDERNFHPHNYPVVVGMDRINQKDNKRFWGTAIVLNKNSAKVMFVDQDHVVSETHILEF